MTFTHYKKQFTIQKNYCMIFSEFFNNIYLKIQLFNNFYKYYLKKLIYQKIIVRDLIFD